MDSRSHDNILLDILIMDTKFGRPDGTEEWIKYTTYIYRSNNWKANHAVVAGKNVVVGMKI